MYINFEEIMERAKRKFDSDGNQREYIISGVELAKRYILDYIKNNPVQTPEELKNGILEELYRESQKFVTISNINGDLFRYEITNLLIKDLKELERLYEKIRSGKSDDGLEYYIDRHFEDKKEDFVRELVKVLDEFKEENEELIDIINRYLQGDKEAKALINEKRSKMPSAKRNNFDNLIKDIGKGDLGILKTFLPDAKENLEERLKKAYIDTLVFLGEFLESNGLLEKYIRRNNQQLSRIGLSELGIDRKEFDENSIFSEEFLSKLDLDELPVMIAFWLNRYTKENEDLNDGIFAINTLNLWGDILEGKTDFEISDEKLKALFCKTEFLKLANDKINKSVIKKLNENTATILDKVDNVAAVDTEEEIEKIEEIVRFSYHNEFEGVLPNSYEQLIDDLRMYTPLTSNITSAYWHKDEILSTQILSYIRNNRIRNWGYIEENGSKKQKGNMVVIGIDYEGYNMPVKLHMRREKIVEILKQAGLDPMIPIYEGNGDFDIHGQILKNHIIMMLTTRNESEIRRLLAENNKSKEIMELLEHLNFLRDNDKYPKHLMTPIKVKGKTTFARRPRRYINLESKEIWIKGKNGSFEKEEGEER